MLKQFLVLIFCLLSATAHAALPCDVFLSQLSEEIDGDDFAGSYVRLIEYYLTQQNMIDSKSALQKIAESQSPIDPFANETDSLSAQLSQALAKVIKKLSAQDWVEIKKQVQALNSKGQEVQADRAEKKQDTSWLLSPRLYSEISDLSNLESPPAWHVVDGRVFIALSSGGKTLYLFELINGELKSIQTQEANESMHGSPSWHTVGGRTFLAIGSQDQHLYFYELINGKLDMASDPVQIGGALQTPPAWMDVGPRTFVAVNSMGRKTQLLELINGRLVLVEQALDVKGYPRGAPQWFTEDDGRIYLAVNIGESRVFIFELVDGHLKLEKELTDCPGNILSAPTWHKSKDSTYLAVVSGGCRLNLYKKFFGNFMRIDKRFEALTGTSVAWIKYAESSYAAVAREESGLELFKLESGDLKSLDVKDYALDLVRPKTPAWFIYEERAFLAYSAPNDHFYIYELVNERLEEKFSIKHESEDSADPVWQLVKDKGLFVAIRASKKLRVIKVVGPTE